MHNNNFILSVTNVTKQFSENSEQKVVAVNNISLKVKKGEIINISGPSGSGKTTLLTILGGMIKPTLGSVFFENYELTKLSDKRLTEFRLLNIGFVFQTFRLLDSLTVLDNVTLPLLISKKLSEKSISRAKELLNNFGLANRMNFHPTRLSGGEKQRVAIARAFANDSNLILADEPTGSLDSKNGQVIIETLCNYARHKEKTVIIVSHDQRINKYADKTMIMEDGFLYNGDHI